MPRETSRKGPLAVSVALGLFAVTAPLSADILQVPGDFPSIQSALDAAVDGDTVVVAPGRYFENLLFPPKAIVLRGSGSADDAVIDGGQMDTVVRFVGTPGRSSVIENLTITNGLDQQSRRAGGIEVAESGSPTIRGNVIRQNFGYGNGHGIGLTLADSPLIIDNEIRHNRSGPGFSGGGGGSGIGSQGSICSGQFQPCGAEIRGNYLGVNRSGSFSSGGAIALNGARATIVGNLIEFNIASGTGGAIDIINGGDVRIENNLFRGNQASFQGGAISVSGGQNDPSPRIVGNTFVGNSAELGSVLFAQGFVANVRFFNNMAVAAGFGGAVECWISGNTPMPELANNNIHAADGIAFADDCAGLAAVGETTYLAPTFFGEDDFRLRPGSVGIDAGQAALSSEALDFAGRSRVEDGDGDGNPEIDLGAFELQDLFRDGFELAIPTRPAAVQAELDRLTVNSSSAQPGSQR